MTLAIQCIDIDAGDPSGLADFWAAALGWRRTVDTPDEVVLEPPPGSLEEGVAPDLLFLRVPEPKLGKNRLHLDLRPAAGGEQADEVARLEALGATRAAVGQDDSVTWVVMRDPEGNEFCVLSAWTPQQQAVVDRLRDKSGVVPEVNDR